MAAAALTALAGGAWAAGPDPLTPAERAWLDRHGPLRYAPDPAFPPFEYFRDNGQVDGLTPELLNLVAQRLGTRVETLRYPTWSDVLDAIRRGEADLLGTVTRTPEREEFLLFTRPYLEVPYVLFVDRSVDPGTKLEDFRGRRLGVVRNYGAHTWLRTRHPELEAVPVETAKEGLLLLSLGRLDAMLETLPVGAQVIGDNSLINVRFLPDVLFSTPQHLAVARDNRILQAILQKGLDQVQEPERAAVIKRWMGYDQLKPRGGLPPWAGRVAVIVLAGLAALVAWNVSLRGMVERQTRKWRDSESRQRLLLDTLPQKVFLKDAHSTYLACNRALARDLKIQPDEIAGRTDLDFFPPALAAKYQADDRAVMASRQTREVDEEYVEYGQTRFIHTVKTPWINNEGDVAGVLGIFWDITDRLKSESSRAELEMQLRQAQKMEAVGRLAGGLAHDFNNILTVVLGNANLLAQDDRLPADAREIAGDITQASGRASDLIRQLLTFSRRQVVKMQSVDLNETVNRMQRIVTPLLGSHVQLVCQLDPALPPVAADPGMMEQVILNLAMNARDAMPQGGCLTIRTETQVSDASSTIAESPRPPGRYVVLSIADTGVGMEEHTRAHLFEPFFTTKETGRGTGLGLATVYGITQQHGGWIEVQSAPGKGSRFSVFLPMAFADASDEEAAPPPHLVGGSECVLVVEDEPSLRKMACSALQRLGYRVLEAASGVDALAAWSVIGPQVQLLFTDIVMPGGVSGLDLARRLRELHPRLKVLFSSGYSDDVFFRRTDLPDDSLFLPKPYDVAKLASFVRLTLDQKR